MAGESIDVLMRLCRQRLFLAEDSVNLSQQKKWSGITAFSLGVSVEVVSWLDGWMNEFSTIIAFLSSVDTCANSLCNQLCYRMAGERDLAINSLY